MRIQACRLKKPGTFTYLTLGTGFFMQKPESVLITLPPAMALAPDSVPLIPKTSNPVLLLDPLFTLSSFLIWPQCAPISRLNGGKRAYS